MCGPLFLNSPLRKSSPDRRKASVFFLIQVNVLFGLAKWLLYACGDDESLRQGKNLLLYIFAVINVPTITTYLEALETIIVSFTTHLWRRKV